MQYLTECIQTLTVEFQGVCLCMCTCMCMCGKGGEGGDGGSIKKP